MLRVGLIFFALFFLYYFIDAVPATTSYPLEKKSYGDLDVTTAKTKLVTSSEYGEPVKRAQTYYERGNTEAAIELLEQEVKVRPDNSLAFHLLGSLYNKSDQFLKGEKAYRKAVSLAPERVISVTNLADTLRNNEKYQEALKYHKKAKNLCSKLISKCSDNVRFVVHSSYSRTLIASEKFEKAKREINLASKFASTEELMGDLHRKQTMIEVEKKLEKSLSVEDGTYK